MRRPLQQRIQRANAQDQRLGHAATRHRHDEAEADRDLAGRGANRVRSPIDDRFWAIKDLRWWWENPHVPKVAGVPTGPPSPWVPREKPIWFTEYGFPSVNCAPNRPNVFVDPKSAESQFPWYSNRSVDRVVQRSAIKGTEQFWRDPANNPVSPLYGGPMVGRRFLWCWDARPFPFFPALTSVWSDGDNYRLGHWVQGKIGTMQLSAIVRDLCLRAGLAEAEIDVSGLTDEAVRGLLTRKPLPAYTPRTLTDPEALAAAVAATRRTSWAMVSEASGA